MSEDNRLIQERKKKLDDLRAAGVEPYPHIFRPKNKAAELQEHKLKPGDETDIAASVAGRIMLFRRMGKISFLTLQDESGRIQLFISESNIGAEQYEMLKKLDMGDFVGAEGVLVATKTGELSVKVKTLQLLCKSIRPLPEKHHGLKDKETRYRKRYLDFLVNPEVKDTFRKRAAIYKAIREFLDERGFIEVQTPILQPLYGGGIARPFTTRIHAWDMQMYLRIAYEIYLKKLIVGGFEKIYDLSSCFRNEGSDKTHNPEFAMMEIQWAYADYEDQMSLTEELWEYVAKKINGTTKITFGETVIDLKAPWRRLRVVDALKEFANIDVDAISEKELFALVEEHHIKVQGELNRGVAIALLFEELCEEHLIQPTHIIDHPIEICPLAKPHRDDARYAERDEPFINAWEVGNIYTELNDPVMQREHFEEQLKQREAGDDEAHPMDEDYIEALEHGLPPNAGNGVGVERMIMLLTENESIRDVILFPTMKPEEETTQKEENEEKKQQEMTRENRPEKQGKGGNNES